MGPGYFPTILGILMLILGILVALPALKPHAEETHVEKIGWRGLLVILGAVALYAFLLPRAGFVVSLIGLIVLSAMGSKEFTWKAALLSCLVLGVFSRARHSGLRAAVLPDRRSAVALPSELPVAQRVGGDVASSRLSSAQNSSTITLVVKCSAPSSLLHFLVFRRLSRWTAEPFLSSCLANSPSLFHASHRCHSTLSWATPSLSFHRVFVATEKFATTVPSSNDRGSIMPT